MWGVFWRGRGGKRKGSEKIYIRECFDREGVRKHIFGVWESLFDTIDVCAIDEHYLQKSRRGSETYG